MTCDGCGEEAEAPGTLWCKTEFGLACLLVHQSQECALAALAKKGWKLHRGNRPPGWEEYAALSGRAE